MTTIPATLHGPNPLPPSAGLASSNATLTDVLGMIRRRLLSIIFLFVVFGSMACGGFYVWWVYLPTYSAVGLIECVTSVPRESLAIADERLPDREHERFVLTQVQMVESPNVINAVLASDDVRSTQWFLDIPARKSAFDELIEQLTVQPVRGTNHMSISMATRHRADARPIVEQVMQQYLESVETRSADRFRDDLDIASGELTRARASLQAKREQLKALAERLRSGKARPSATAELAEIKESIFAAADVTQPQWDILRSLQAGCPDDTILVPDSTQIGYYSFPFWKVERPKSYIGSGYSGNLGYAFPTGLGAKVAQPDRPVVVVAGDGGFMYNPQEMSTAVQHGINIVVVVFNDNAFGNVGRDLDLGFGGAYGTDLHNPDFSRLARSYGMKAIKVDDPATVGDSVADAIQMNAPVLVEVPVGRMPVPAFFGRRPQAAKAS